MRPKQLHVEWRESRMLLQASIESYNRLSRALFGHDYHWNLLQVGGRGYGKRAMLEKIRAQVINRPASAITQTELLKLDPSAVKWRCPRPTFLTDRTGIALANAILRRNRGKNGTSHPKVP